MNDNYNSFNHFNLECCKIFGCIILAHIRRENISVAQLSKMLLPFGKSYNYRSLYIGLTGFNSYVKDFRWFKKIFEVLEIEIDSHTFAQLLQDSQHFNANFKAKKQAKIEENKRNKQK